MRCRSVGAGARGRDMGEPAPRKERVERQGTGSEGEGEGEEDGDGGLVSIALDAPVDVAHEPERREEAHRPCARQQRAMYGCCQSVPRAKHAETQAAEGGQTQGTQEGHKQVG